LLVGLGAAAFIAAAHTPGAYARDEPASLGFSVSPGAGPPGTRVHFEGNVPADADDFSTYQLPQFAYGLALLTEDATVADCNLIIGLDDVEKTVTEDGHVTGSFTVGAVGGCFMSPTDVGPQRARPGVYMILLSCHACTPIGTFQITSHPLARTGDPIALLASVGVGLAVSGLAFVALSCRLRARSSPCPW
jgi:hypothetical protein